MILLMKAEVYKIEFGFALLSQNFLNIFFWIDLIKIILIYLSFILTF